MLVIRPVAHHDLSDLLQLAEKAGAGMTSLPPCESSLAQKIERSVHSFIDGPGCKTDDFLLVMEDTEKHKVIGTAGVHARTGSRQAFYAYRLMSVNHYAHSLNKEVRNQALHLSNDYSDCSEIGTLFIDPSYRGNGHWLGQARYMLMAQFTHRFGEQIIAQLRGQVDASGHSPFWDAIGAHFFDMSFSQADALCGTDSNQFITELMPKHPIYTCLLPKAARQAIGVAHNAGKRAQELLLGEGFAFENVVDIFDAGPMLRASLKQIKSVKNLTVISSSTTLNTAQTSALSIANTSLTNFRVTQAPAYAQHSGRQHQSEHLSNQVRDALQLNPGDKIAYLEKLGD